MILEWIKGKVNFLVVRREIEPDEPPMELYAHSVVMFLKDGFVNVAGFSLSASDDDARKAAEIGAAKMYNERRDDYLGHSVHITKLDSVALDAIREAYGLKDELVFWREQLEK